MTCKQHIDWQAVLWVAEERIKMNLSRLERAEVIKLLANKMPRQELADLVGVHKHSVTRIKNQLSECQ